MLICVFLELKTGGVKKGANLKPRKGLNRIRVKETSSPRFLSWDLMSEKKKLRESEDARLARRFIEGEREAFSVLVKRYEEPVFNVIMRMVGDREEARDLAQEAFVRAFEGIETFDCSLPFGAWMYRIAVNVSIDHLRRKKLNRVPLDEAFFDGEIPSHNEERAKGHLQQPEETSIRNETSQALREALIELPDKYRAVIVLHHLEGMSYAEISKVLGVPKNTAKTWGRRGRLILSELLEGVI